MKHAWFMSNLMELKLNEERQSFGQRLLLSVIERSQERLLSNGKITGSTMFLGENKSGWLIVIFKNEASHLVLSGGIMKEEVGRGEAATGQIRDLVFR